MFLGSWPVATMSQPPDHLVNLRVVALLAHEQRSLRHNVLDDICLDQLLHEILELVVINRVHEAFDLLNLSLKNLWHVQWVFRSCRRFFDRLGFEPCGSTPSDDSVRIGALFFSTNSYFSPNGNCLAECQSMRRWSALVTAAGSSSCSMGSPGDGLNLESQSAIPLSGPGTYLMSSKPSCEI